MNQFEEAEIMRRRSIDITKHFEKVKQEIEMWPQWKKELLSDRVICQLDGGSTQEVKPNQVIWQTDDLAWETQHNHLVKVTKICMTNSYYKIQVISFDNSITYWVSLDMITIPTRAQLAKEIGKGKDGKPILAWAACEDTDGDTLITYSDRDSVDFIRTEHVHASHIPIVTRSQIDRHYNGVFPPKEQDNAD